MPLSPDHISFLSEYLNPVYLQKGTIAALSQRFADESSLELHDLLCAPLADKLVACLRDRDNRDGLGPNRPQRIPPHTAGVETESGWQLKGPPHKWRYAVLAAPSNVGSSDKNSERMAQSVNGVLHKLEAELFASSAFRAWLANITQMLPLRYAAEARRFRPGLVCYAYFFARNLC